MADRDQINTWTLTKDGGYSSKSVYAFITHLGVNPPFPHIPWNLRISSKANFFLWLLAKDRLLTNANLRKRNWPCDTSCVLCSTNADEDADLLFI
jgi:zinc-binding in reverse transcriptase